MLSVIMMNWHSSYRGGELIPLMIRGMLTGKQRAAIRCRTEGRVTRSGDPDTSSITMPSEESEMHKKYNPSDLAPVYSNYVNCTEVEPGKRWLFVSGQCGVRQDGSVPEDFTTQCEVAMDNVLANLREAGMAAEDVVKLTFFMTSREDIASAREVRDRKLGGTAVSSTLILVSGFILPVFKIEIECIAAK